MNPQLDREVEYLEEEYNNGNITMKEFQDGMRDIRNAARGEAEAAAERAYNDTMDW